MASGRIVSAEFPFQRKSCIGKSSSIQQSKEGVYTYSSVVPGGNRVLARRQIG